LSLAITPAAGTANAPISTEVGIALAGGKITEVSLTKAWQRRQDPRRHARGRNFVDSGRAACLQLQLHVAVTGRGNDGKTVTRKTSFTTMAQPGSQAETALYMFDGEAVGGGHAGGARGSTLPFP